MMMLMTPPREFNPPVFPITEKSGRIAIYFGIDTHGLHVSFHFSDPWEGVTRQGCLNYFTPHRVRVSEPASKLNNRQKSSVTLRASSTELHQDSFPACLGREAELAPHVVAKQTVDLVQRACRDSPRPERISVNGRNKGIKHLHNAPC